MSKDIVQVGPLFRGRTSSLDAICAALAKPIDACTPKCCANYFKNAGYAAT
jgi:hypothetical protein